MPPSARKPAPKKPDDEPKPVEAGEICLRCWPNGWPGQDNAASCEHGTWQR